MNHKRKCIVPVIIVALLCAYYIALAVVIGRIPQLPLWAKIAAVVLPLVICGALIGVLAQRIREIRSGEEDDLDRY